MDFADTRSGPIGDTRIPVGPPAPAGPNGIPMIGEDIAGAYEEYFVNRSPEELAVSIAEMVNQTKQIMRAAGIYRRARSNYNLFYARDSNSSWEENLREDGDSGGSMYMSVNVLKNAIDHLIQMVTSHKPAIDPVTVNSSVAANDITSVAKALIDYRLHQQKDIDIIDECLKQTPILSLSYLHAFWNKFKGKKTQSPGKGGGIVNQTLPDGTPTTPIAFTGDLEIECLSLLDVYFDLAATSWERIDDCVVRVFRNRYNLMVEHPDLSADLRVAPARQVSNYDEFLPTPVFVASQAARTRSQDAMIEVWMYYHKRTAACPYGKMQAQLPSGVVIESGPLPEWMHELPIFRMCPDGMVGTTQGYAATTAAGGLQEGLNIGSSAMLTNMAAFSRKLIIAQKGADIDVANITGDLKFLEADFSATGTPPVHAIDLLGTQQPLLEMLGWFVGQIEQNTGANSIVRGDPKGVTAGVAINLYQSMALQSASSFEAVRSAGIAWFATTLVRAYQDHPDVKREVMILGSAKTTFLKNFYGSELSGIDSFTVDAGNPATRTLAMRYNMAVALKQDGVPIPPDKLVHLMRTGDWDSTVEGGDALDDVIRRENEQMAQGIPAHVIPGDDPVRHAQGHLVVLSDQRVRNNPQLLNGVMQHIDQHMQQMSQGDIVVKLAAGMLPMGPFPPPGGTVAHGDTPAPNHPGASPQGQPGGKPAPQQGKPAPAGESKMAQIMGQSGTAPGRKPEAVKPPPAIPAPPIPGVGGQQ